jgi:hypothetical protein
MAQDIVDLLANDLELAFEFYCAASEIVDDFEDYGPQLAGTEVGEYDESTPIGKLQAARNQIIARLEALSAARRET